MHTAIRSLCLLLAMLVVTPAAAQLPNIQDSAVWGRIGNSQADGGSGPSQAIPFATLLVQMGAVPATRNINTTSPLAGGGNLSVDRTISLGTQSANQVLAGPTTGSAAAPGFRAIVGADLPNPSGSTLGGIEALTCATHQWLNTISTGGVPACAQPSVTDISGGAALTSSNDTNVTVTLGGTPASALLAASSITMGWTGTLAAGRLNANVVQNFTNDTNVTATITAQNATLGWSGQLALGRGGTGQSTANAARQSSGLNVWGDQGTGHGDAGVTIGNTERFAYTNAAFTASRAWVLPAANVTGQPYAIQIADMAGGVTASNTLVITRAGADTIDGGTTATISAAHGGYICTSDGVSKWTCQATGPASGGGVTSVTCGTGLTGGTITTSGTCAVSLSTASNVLGADVSLNNTANYFDGPSMAQGTSGAWFASGQVTVIDTAGGANIYCKLWDGTTTIASGAANIGVANGYISIALSGTLVTPAGNLRISCKDITSTSGKIQFNHTGNSADSSIYGHRIN
jgi:hypothetical protein